MKIIAGLYSNQHHSLILSIFEIVPSTRVEIELNASFWYQW